MMPSAGLAQDPRLAVNVIGFLDDSLGLAQAARLYIDALRAARVPVATTAIAPDAPAWRRKAIERYGKRAHDELRTPFEPAFNLACLNGDHLVRLARAAGGEVLVQRPTIGQWAWETDVLPPDWLPAFHFLEEIWTFSTFVGDNLGRLSPVPVVVIPMAVEVPDPSRVELPIARDDRFTFLFMFDFFSTLRRKNAAGLIEAFARGFAPGEGPRLLLKTINGRFRPEVEAELRRKVTERPDIELVDAYLEPAQNAALLARADCYVSLHRSEGFGLTLAESMALGTPVIATGYSGNTDFTTPHNSYLVDWTPTRVGPGCDIYPAEGSWAEPDLDHAAELMRRVWEQPEEARAKADRARSDIRRLYAPEVVGRLARARLERLADRTGDAVPSARLDRLADRTGDAVPRLPAAGASAALSELRLAALEDELAFDPERGAPPAPGGLRGVLRRLVLRLMLPFTMHERKFDRVMADALGGLHAELAHERAMRVADRARIDRLEERLLHLGDTEIGRRREG
jgi:glycosyltransferase involved in cell wall biosynthesis